MLGGGPGMGTGLFWVWVAWLGSRLGHVQQPISKYIIHETFQHFCRLVSPDPFLRGLDLLIPECCQCGQQVVWFPDPVGAGRERRGKEGSGGSTAAFLRSVLMRENTNVK